jgi:hypothetical protein
MRFSSTDTLASFLLHGNSRVGEKFALTRRLDDGWDVVQTFFALAPPASVVNLPVPPAIDLTASSDDEDVIVPADDEDENGDEDDDDDDDDLPSINYLMLPRHLRLTMMTPAPQED